MINPYLDSFGAPRPVAGAIRPAPGSYDVVFDTPAPAAPRRAPYTFRFWVNDVTPPSVRLLTPHREARGTRLRLAVTDAGSRRRSALAVGDDRRQGGRRHLRRAAARRSAWASSPPAGTGSSSSASDYQELKNMENVPQILPNTSSFTATFTVR